MASDFGDEAGQELYDWMIRIGQDAGGNRGPEGLSAGYDDSAAEGEMLLRGCSYRDHG